MRAGGDSAAARSHRRRACASVIHPSTRSIARKVASNVAIVVTSPSMPPPVDTERIAAQAREMGIRRVHMLAWRDLADVEAGGSEIHAANIAKRWAEAGLEVTMRTSYAQGHAPIVERDGYHVVRRAGRYLVFPRAVLSELVEWHGRWDAVVEIWNGVPFFSPLWSWLRSRPHLVFLHHLHAEMWRMVLPEN